MAKTYPQLQKIKRIAIDKTAKPIWEYLGKLQTNCENKQKSPLKIGRLTLDKPVEHSL